MRRPAWRTPGATRLRRILHEHFETQGIDVDYYFYFQALLLTHNLVHGSRGLARQLQTVAGLSAFVVELHVMVRAYQNGVPTVKRWFREVMAQPISSYEVMAQLMAWPERPPTRQG